VDLYFSWSGSNVITVIGLLAGSWARQQAALDLHETPGEPAGEARFALHELTEAITRTLPARPGRAAVLAASLAPV
jgi:hypothetical protein